MKSGKFRFLGALLLLLGAAVFAPGAFAEEATPEIAPLSPQFLEWQRQQNQQDAKEESAEGAEVRISVSSAGSETALPPAGYIPDPVDLSHLEKDPPVEPDVPMFRNGTSYGAVTDAKYDPRTTGLKMDTYMPTRNQNPWGTCWAFAATGAAEAYALTNVQQATTIDLSEYLTAYFVYGDKRAGKSFAYSGQILNKGGNATQSTALMARLGGLTNDGTFYKYPNASSYTAPNVNKYPETYTHAYRLRDTYNLGSVTSSNRADIKKLILENGGVQVSYSTSGQDFNTVYHYNKNTGSDHAVVLVGWDDNVAATKFSTKPSGNGAWLVRNSWSSTSNSSYKSGEGHGGYFWMSYNQAISYATVYQVEKADNKLRHYGYDDLGATGSTSYKNKTAYMANVFLAEATESLKDVAFYTQNNNVTCEISVYDNGTSKPGSPMAGTPLFTGVKSTQPRAGYHVVDVSGQGATVTAGRYFSVVVKMTHGSQNVSIPVEYPINGYAVPNVVKNVSYISSNGSSWSVSNSYNVCVKAFTTASGTNPPVIATTSLTNAVPKSAYSATLSGYCWGGSTTSTAESITWSATGLPTSLTCSPAGKITGTPQVSEKGSYKVTVTATSKNGATARKTVSLTVVNAPVITTASLPTGTVKKAYSATLKADGATPITWALKSGKLPTGLKLSTAGVISGTPSAQGTFSFVVTAKNSLGTGTSGTLKIVVNPAPTKPSISTSSLANGTVGKAYSQKIAASAANTNIYPLTWSGSISPAGSGLSFSGSGTAGTLKGTPAKAGTYTLTVKVTNAAGAISKALKFKILDVKPAITTSAMGPITLNAAWSLKVGRTGTGTITWAASGLPSGLSINKSTGVISGKPTKVGSFKVTLKATNTGGTASRTITLVVKDVAPAISTASLPQGTVKAAYSVTMKASGTNIVWSATGLPAGLSINASKGLISGKPTTAGTYSVKVSAKNSTKTDTKAYSLKVVDVKPVIKTASLANGTVKKAYTATLALSAGTGNVAWSCSGALPPGLKMSGTKISGTPTKSGTYSFTVSAKNTGGTGTKALKIVIADVKPAIKTSSLPNGTVGIPYSQTLALSAGTGNVTWTATGLPAGLTLAKNGSLSGTPTKEGKFSMTVKAANSAGTVSKTLKLTVAAKPPITTKTAGEFDEDSELLEEDVLEAEDLTEEVSSGVEEEAVEADEQSSAPEEVNEGWAKLGLVAGDTVIWDDVVEAAVGSSLTFELGAWSDADGNAVEAAAPEVYVNDELDGDATIGDDGRFTLTQPLEADGDLYVYVTATAEGQTLKSDTIFVTAVEGPVGSVNTSSGGGSHDSRGCNSTGAGFAAAALLALLPKAVRKKR